MNDNNDMAILVVSCDAYADVANYFFALMNKYWIDCNYPTYFINNTINRSYGDNVILINAGNDQDWSGRLKSSLGQIKARYILLMLDDYYIGKAIDSKKIKQAIDIMKSENLLYYRITNIPKGKKQYKNYSFLSPIPDNQPYGVNLQCAIWEKEYLISYLGEKDCSAWEVETNYLKKVKNRYCTDVKGCVVDTRNIIDIHNAVIKGKWNPSTIKYFKNKGYSFNLEPRKQLNLIDRFSIRLRKFIRSCLTNDIRRKIKRIMSKLGIKFTSEY